MTENFYVLCHFLRYGSVIFLGRLFIAADTDNAFNGKREGDTLRGSAAADSIVKSLQNGILDLIDNEDHYDLLFGLNGNIKQLFRFLGGSSSAVHDGTALSADSARGIHSHLRKAVIQDAKNNFKLIHGYSPFPTAMRLLLKN